MIPRARSQWGRDEIYPDISTKTKVIGVITVIIQLTLPVIKHGNWPSCRGGWNTGNSSISRGEILHLSKSDPIKYHNTIPWNHYDKSPYIYIYIDPMKSLWDPIKITRNHFFRSRVPVFFWSNSRWRWTLAYGGRQKTPGWRSGWGGRKLIANDE